MTLQPLTKYFDTFSSFALAFLHHKWSRNNNCYHQKLNVRNVLRIARQFKTHQVKKLRTFAKIFNLPAAIAQSPLQKWKSGKSARKFKQITYWTFHRKCHFTQLRKPERNILWRIVSESRTYFARSIGIFFFFFRFKHL